MEKLNGNWTLDEHTILKNNFQLPITDLCILLPNRTKVAIYNKIFKLKYKKDNRSHKKGDLSFLLEETPLTYYWIGFIMADGCFTGKSLTTLDISISEYDINHLEKLSKIINIKCKSYFKKPNSFCKNGSNIIKILACDAKLCPLICNKFDFKRKKTYNPPERLPNDNKELLISMLCGLIDGDGTIVSNRNYIRITCHSSWKNFYELLNSKIFIKENSITLNNRGYLEYGIYKLDNIMYLLNSIRYLNLPLLDRKWCSLIKEYKEKL